MPRAKFVKTAAIPETFRNAKVKSLFDLDISEVRKEYDVELPLEGKDWNVGLIVGSSGSGKTSLAKEIFPKEAYFTGHTWHKEKTVVDDFPQTLSAKEITEILSQVGFSSPPDWLKPFSCLSSGQKFRVELARAIVEAKDLLVFDEFSSVVDRQVAQVGSFAVQKFLRQKGKQFVAVSCHFDITSWSLPDWVYNTDTGEFQWRSLRRRPDIQLSIRHADRKEWKHYQNHHYLSGCLNPAAQCYVAEVGDRPVAFCAVSHFPHPKIRNMKRIHRIVVLPDWQGVGIGRAFLTEVAKMYHEKRYRVRLCASNIFMFF